MKITVTRTFTYDVDRILEDWATMNGGIPCGIDDALELIEEWALEDMGRPVSRNDMVFTDDAGNVVVLS